MLISFEHMSMLCREYHLFTDFQLQRLALRGVSHSDDFDAALCRPGDHYNTLHYNIRLQSCIAGRDGLPDLLLAFDSRGGGVSRSMLIRGLQFQDQQLPLHLVSLTI